MKMKKTMAWDRIRGRQLRLGPMLPNPKPKNKPLDPGEKIRANEAKEF